MWTLIRTPMDAETHSHVNLEQMIRWKTDRTQCNLYVSSIPSTLISAQKCYLIGDTGIMLFMSFVTSYCTLSGANISARISQPASTHDASSFFPFNLLELRHLSQSCWNGVKRPLRQHSVGSCFRADFSTIITWAKASGQYLSTSLHHSSPL